MDSAAQLKAIVERARNLEPSAFDELIERYSVRLYNFMYRLTAQRDDAQEMVQEVYLRLVRMLPDYRDDGRFEAWLFRIALNLARDRMRRKRRGPAFVCFEGSASESAQHVQHDPVDHRQTPQLASDDHRAELSRKLDEALAQLPDAEREVILLRHYAGKIGRAHV